MKAKVLLSIAIAAISAFSFTFVSSEAGKKKTDVKEVNKKEVIKASEPIGGFIMEERIEP